VPTGNAAGQTVTVKYDPLRADGRRLVLTVGSKEIRTDLYDWEIIPIARFAESGFAACMTLFDKPRTEEEKETDNLFDAEGEEIGWANFHPAFGDTLIGLNLFFVDAMFVKTDLFNIDLIQFADEVFVFPVPGYHKPRLSRRDTDIARRSLHKKYIDLELAFEAENVNTYIYTDYGTEINYRIRNRKIVFTGVPSYLFFFNDKANETATPAERLNEQIAALHKQIHAINPVVYRSAERTAQWAAFFRMVKNDYSQAWEEFMAQIDSIEPAPRVETPRYWMP
jgi:outer membrane murein-binding lipoprotein Lpp